MTEKVEIGPGRVLLFGGAYSNLGATQAIRATADRLGIAPTNCICTGDIVAYCARPEETVDLIRDWGIPTIMGNCEESLASEAVDCGCGFEPGSVCSTLSLGWYEFANQHIGAENRAWMKTLPRQVSFRFADRSFVVVHGSFSQINRFVFPSTAVEVKQAELDLGKADVLIGGHCGVPFGERVGSGAWLNAGAIGLPANDGTTDGWYLLLTPDGDGFTAQWHRLRYDAHAESTDMLGRGMNADYADALLTGLWPSVDILPEYERDLRGKRLAVPPMRL